MPGNSELKKSIQFETTATPLDGLGLQSNGTGLYWNTTPVGGGGSQTLQQTCDFGNTTTTDINLTSATSSINYSANIIINGVAGLFGAVQIGQDPVLQPLGADSTNVGKKAGINGHSGVRAVNIGFSAGENNCGSRSVNIGDEAGENNSGFGSVNIGTRAGDNGTGVGCIAIGGAAGLTAMTAGSVAIGYLTAPTIGDAAVALGTLAGKDQMDDNSIVINATGSGLDTTVANSCVIDPIRTVESAENSEDILHRNPTTKELYMDRIRYSFRTVEVAAGGTTTQLTAADPSIIIVRWTGGTGNHTVYLPDTADVPLGTFFIVKNFGETAAQRVLMDRKQLTSNTIDTSATVVELDSSTRSTTGGGGSCMEVLKVGTNEWALMRGYYQSFG